jgi:hypothetical protein
MRVGRFHYRNRPIGKQSQNRFLLLKRVITRRPARLGRPKFGMCSMGGNRPRHSLSRPTSPGQRTHPNIVPHTCQAPAGPISVRIVLGRLKL